MQKWVEKRAFLFPGQGSQFVGMGRGLGEAAVGFFQKANEVLKFDIAELCENGPEEKLNLTENTQPAIVLISAILLDRLKEMGVQACFGAGHSLGEYAAHFAAGSISFEDLLSTVRNRGRYMQEAAPVGSGAMAAVLGLDSQKVKEVCLKAEEHGLVKPANYNSPEQTVIAGEKAGVLRAMELAKEAGAKRAILLPVSAPFHTELIKEAEIRLMEDIKNTPFSDPKFPVVTNVDALPVTNVEESKNALVRQVCGPVRWVESIQYLVSQGVTQFVEIGPGKVLSGLVRRIDRGVKVYSVSNESSLLKTVEAIENDG
ncbi:MAG: ACP S-malonyltransferase [Nitrospinota bacterium]